MPLTPQDFDELEDSFRYNDANEDGRIGFEEFMSMLDALEAGVGLKEARLGFSTIDADRDGAIDLDEFIDWWSDR